jgi:tetrahydromethanopterin S-methyltransferase subunit G
VYDRSVQLDLLLELESRQDDVMLRLEELDRRVEKTLAECLLLRSTESQEIARKEAA